MLSWPRRSEGTRVKEPDGLRVINFSFTMLSWPRGSEGTRWPSSQATTCLPCKVETSDCLFLLLNVKQGICEYQFLWFLI